mgnify:CR=1 FL=1
MFDGIKLSSRITDFEAWRQTVELDFTSQVDTRTGEVINFSKAKDKKVYKYFSSYRNYRLVLKEVHFTNESNYLEPSYYLTIRGSLHKSFFGGQNYEFFSWMDIQEEINTLVNGLKIHPEKTYLRSIELGLNIPVPFNVIRFLESDLLMYRSSFWNQYRPDNQGVKLGFFCNCAHYDVKLYDKGLQYKLPYDLMRFEVKFKKMQKLNRMQIETLADLQNLERANKLFDLLQDMWSNVLLWELNAQSLSKLSKVDVQLIENGRSPDFWKNLWREKRSKFHNMKKRLGKITNQQMDTKHHNVQNKIKSMKSQISQMNYTLPLR